MHKFYVNNILALLLFLSAASLFAQSVRVEYIEESKRKFPPGTTQAAMDFMRFTKAVLLATPEQSWYETARDSTIEEQMDTRSLSPEVLKQLPLGSDIPQEIVAKRKWSKNAAADYKSFTSNVSLSYTKMYGEKLHTEQPLQVYDWTITNETAVIAGMLCKKATATLPSQSAIEAWFTDEIPLANGPAIYHGLPGLILKVEAAYVTISATKVSLVENPEIKRWTDSRLVAESDLFESLKKVAEEKRSKPIKNDN
jgi:GLPGLI family protein